MPHTPYISQSLSFEDDKIYFLGNNSEEREVMMDWEDILMSASAAYVTENGGDILEIGFGMGISADYIQSHSIKSHTICENHPQIIPLALDWASNKPNVTIITGSWYSNLNNLSTYDGLFYDTYGDADNEYFPTSLANLMNVGGKATWWNGSEGDHFYPSIQNVTYEQHIISPPLNSYFNSTTYYLPKKQF